MFHLYGRIKGFRPKSIKLLKTRPTLTVFQFFFFFSNLLMSNTYLMYMDMINEDRFAYHVLIRRLRGSVMNLRYLNYDGTLRVFKLNEPPSLEWWRDKAEKGDTARYVAGLYLNVGDCFFRRKNAILTFESVRISYCVTDHLKPLQQYFFLILFVGR